MQQMLNTFNALHGNPMFLGLIAIMFIDIVSGYSKAFISKSYNSTIDSRGWLKRVNTLTILVIGYPFLALVDVSWLWNLFAITSIIANAGSVIENLTALGVPIPEQITQYLDEKKTKL